MLNYRFKLGLLFHRILEVYLCITKMEDGITISLVLKNLYLPIFLLYQAQYC